MQRQNSEHLSDGRLAMPVAYIADSEAHARICAMEALLERGFVCREFSDSSDLLDALRSQSPDLIVLDVSIRKSAADEALRLLLDAHPGHPNDAQLKPGERHDPIRASVASASFDAAVAPADRGDRA